MTRVAVLVAALGLITCGASAAAATPDQRIAWRAQAQLRDLPEGWRTTSPPRADERSKILTQARKVAKATASSERAFAHNDDGALTRVSVYRSAGVARRAFDAYRSETLWADYAEEQARNLKSEGIKDVSVDQGRFLLGGFRVAAYGREIELSGNGKNALGVEVRSTLTIHYDIALKGRAVVTLQHFGFVWQALSLSEERAVLRSMLSRLATATAAPSAPALHYFTQVKPLYGVDGPPGKIWTYNGDYLLATFAETSLPRGEVRRYKVCHTGKATLCVHRQVKGDHTDVWRLRVMPPWAGYVGNRYTHYIRFTWFVNERLVSTKTVWVWE